MKKKIERSLIEKTCFITLGSSFLLVGLGICLISVPLILVLVGFFTFIPGSLLVILGYALLKESKYKKGGKKWDKLLNLKIKNTK